MSFLDKLHRLKRDESGLPPHREEPQPDDAVSRPQQVGPPIRLIRAGDVITWQRGDGSVHRASVDFIHVDETGTCWAFVTIGSGWAAINLTVARRV